MKQLPLKKLSILGLVLTAASAVTAAIIPSDEQKDENLQIEGTLVASTGNGSGDTQSCVLDPIADGQDCGYTVTTPTRTDDTGDATDTSTAQGILDTSSDDAFDGINDTSTADPLQPNTTD